MDSHPTNLAATVFPAAPDRVPLYPAASQQQALTGLTQAVREGLHLLCLSGPTGSGKTVLVRQLREELGTGLVGLLERPEAGRILYDLAEALQIQSSDRDESALRRRLVMRLSAVNQRRQPIVLIVDNADTLPNDDLNLLLHFFPPGYTSLVLVGADAPETWLANGILATGAPATPDAHFRLGAFSAVETAGYIRHRLRVAQLSDTLLSEPSLHSLHTQSSGLPGGINLLAAVALTEALQTHGIHSVKAAGGGAVPAPRESSSQAQSSTSARAAPRPRAAPLDPAPSNVQPVAKSLAATVAVPIPPASIPTTPAERPAAVKPRAQPGPRAPDSAQIRRLRRSARRWRSIAVLSSLGLVAVLTLVTTQEVTHIPDDSASLAAFEPAATATDAVERPETSAAGTETAWIDVPVADRDEPESFMDRAERSDFAALQAFAQEPDVAFETALATPPEAAPETAPEAAVAAPLTATERRRLARLYRDRAAYEIRKGELAAASVSIRNGLKIDPDNPQLLRMRKVVYEVMY